MAVQIESRGQLAEFLEILRRRRWQVLLPAAFVIAFGCAFAVIVPKKYLLRTQVELRPISVSVSSKDGANAAFQIKARTRVRKVVEDLKNETYLTLPPTERNDFITDLQSDVKVSPVRTGDETTFVNIEYASVDVLWARTFLKALRDDWITDVLERDRNKLRDEKAKLYEDAQRLDREVQREEAAVTDLKRKYNLSATQPVPGASGTRSEDPVYSRLIQNLQQVGLVEGELEKNSVELDTLRTRYDEMPLEILGEEQVVAGTSNEAQLDELDAQIRELEKQLAGYLPSHPKFKQLSRDKAELLERREQTARVVTRAEVIQPRRANPAREPLLQRIEALELEQAKLEKTRSRLEKQIDEDQRAHAELQSVHEDLRVRNGNIETTRRLLDETRAALNVKSQKLEQIEGPLGNPFSITEEVVPPPRPTEPNPWMIVAFSIVAGLATGLALALGLEYSKSSFRNVAEINRVMVVPVLGNVNTIVTTRELRLAAARRLLVGVSSILLIGSVAFVTWAWAKSPELLSSGLRDKIELVRAKFR